MNGPVSVIMYVRWGNGVRLGTTSSERAIPRHSEIQTSVLSVFRVKYLYHYLCTICRLARIASKGCRHSAEIIHSRAKNSETPPLIMIPSRCDSPSPLRRAAHLGLVCPYSLGDAQYLGRITQHYRQCREATVLQIVHRERPAVLYPQASRSPHTESGYRLYRYPIMSIGMHLQCRVQL